MKKLKVVCFLAGLLCLVSCDQGNSNTAVIIPEENPDVPPTIEYITITLNYYQQNLDDDNYTLTGTDQKSFFLPAGGTILYSDYKDIYEGFTLQTFDDITIDGNSSITEVNLKYDRKIYTVTYEDGLGGIAKNMPEPVKCRYGAKIPKPDTKPTAKFYEFVEWVVPESSSTVNADITLKAKWQDTIPYSVETDLKIVDVPMIYYSQEIKGDNVIYTLTFSFNVNNSVVTWIIDGKTKEEWDSLGFISITPSEDTQKITITKTQYNETSYYEAHQIIAVTAINGVPYEAEMTIY